MQKVRPTAHTLHSSETNIVSGLTERVNWTCDTSGLVHCFEIRPTKMDFGGRNAPQIIGRERRKTVGGFFEAVRIRRLRISAGDKKIGPFRGQLFKEA
jgi:hypothetical protein